MSILFPGDPIVIWALGKNSPTLIGIFCLFQTRCKISQLELVEFDSEFELKNSTDDNEYSRYYGGEGS